MSLNNNNRKTRFLSLLLLVLAPAWCLGGAPIVERSHRNGPEIGELSSLAVRPATPSAPSQPLSSSGPISSSGNQLNMEQKVGRLEGQVTFLMGQHRSSKLEGFQQALEVLQGRLEEQEQKIKQLNVQIRELQQSCQRQSAPEKNIGTSGAEGGATGGASDQQAVPASPAKAQEFANERLAYQSAIDLLPDKKKESAKLLRQYLDKYPKGSYVASAHYWLGEIYYSSRDFEKASAEFGLVVTQHPKSNRVPDALLKQALLYQEQGKASQATKTLNQLLKLYPKSAAAAQAGKMLPTKVN